MNITNKARVFLANYAGCPRQTMQGVPTNHARCPRQIMKDVHANHTEFPRLITQGVIWQEICLADFCFYFFLCVRILFQAIWTKVVTWISNVSRNIYSPYPRYEIFVTCSLYFIVFTHCYLWYFIIFTHSCKLLLVYVYLCGYSCDPKSFLLTAKVSWSTELFCIIRRTKRLFANILNYWQLFIYKNSTLLVTGGKLKFICVWSNELWRAKWSVNFHIIFYISVW